MRLIDLAADMLVRHGGHENMSMEQALDHYSGILQDIHDEEGCGGVMKFLIQFIPQQNS